MFFGKRINQILSVAIILLAIFFPPKTFGQTTLSAGDIAVIAFKTSTDDEAGNDCVKLVNLVDLACATTFTVTDNNWNGSTWACDDDEFGTRITCNVPIAAGSIFYLDVSSGGAGLTCTGGSVTRTDLGSPWGTNFGFNDEGDNIYVLQGTRASPSFIYAWKHVGAFATATCSNKDKSALPSNLTLGTSAIAMVSVQDQWHYNCVTNNGSKAAILAAIGNTANWVSTTGQSWSNLTGFFTVTTGLVQYGVLSVSGAGCGCLNNCQLAYSGGVNCPAGGVAGNCTAGQTAMSKSINVPGGCTYTVSATMRLRTNGCGGSGSGADGGDQLKVDISGGVKSFQVGASDGTISDSYTLAGPGTIVVSGTANRADEIITYSVSIPCGTCLTILPIELAEFGAEKKDETIELNWTTMSEKENSFFVIERSADAAVWDAINIVAGQGNSFAQHHYTIVDPEPLKGLSYYRLKQVDNSGEFSFSKTVSVDNSEREKRKLMKAVNIYGQETNEDAKGLVILIYDNGDVKKIFKN